MDIQNRKIHFVQEFLRLNNENLIEKLEQLLHLEKMKAYEAELSPMSINQFNQIIDKAEDDDANNRMTSTPNLKDEIDTWR